MSLTFPAAVETLYQGPVDSFVAERKRLAAELKAVGDKDGAARLAKLGRPSISAWVVNQLWWHEREAFEVLFAAADQLKKGKRDAAAAHRDALAALRALAAKRLESGGHAAAEATLRRVVMTLSALATIGSFEPDPAGALAADRDPPGFEALELMAMAPREEEPEPRTRHAKNAAKHGDDKAQAERREDEERERKRIEEEHRRREEERARKRAEREKLAKELRSTQDDAAKLELEAARVREELRGAEGRLSKAREKIEKLKEALAALGDEDRAR